MSKIIKSATAFIPDVVIVVEFKTSTGQLEIKTGNMTPINPLLMCSLFSQIISANINKFMENSRAMPAPIEDKPNGVQ